MIKPGDMYIDPFNIIFVYKVTDLEVSWRYAVLHSDQVRTKCLYRWRRTEQLSKFKFWIEQEWIKKLEPVQ